jgi:hypothetical protein
MFLFVILKMEIYKQNQDTKIHKKGDNDKMSVK